MSQSLSFDRVALRYDATRGYPPNVARQIAEGLMRLGQLEPGASVLELGIGTGRIALPLLERGVNVTGVDISPLMLEQLSVKYEAARQAAPGADWGTLNAQVADITALPFADRAFDAVVAVHVLHLVVGWRQALDEALRVPRPGGSFLLGQDVTAADAVNHQIQDAWLRFVYSLGFRHTRVGASGYGEIMAALRAKGLTPHESILASWTQAQTPNEVIHYIATRTWSQTWSIPDDIFAESLRLLDIWVQARYDGSRDTPMPTCLSFKVASVEVR
jgi:ubiquinone/menaquinone biosynthesis C-methylase UbiE